MITIRFLRVRFNKVVCVYKSALNCCVRFQRVKSNYYNDDLLSRGISVVQNISLSPRKRRTHQQKKTQTRKRGKNKSLGCGHFFCVKKTPLSAALFGCFRVRRIIWCVNSSLFSLLNRLVQRDTRREEDKEEGGRGRLCVLFWIDSRRVLLFEITRKEETFVVFIERGEISLRDEWVRRISHQSDRIETSARKYVYNKCGTRT